MRINPLPDFIVIGAMKSATTTLHEQLAGQPSLCMSRPKEPNFFSDDENYAKGFDWYASIFERAATNHLCGESSTHYTKLPTYPQTVDRMVRALPRVKLIYVMRHPIDRLTSHYYGRYSVQLAPYFQAYGPEAVHPVFFDRLVRQPDEELERIGRFLGVEEPLRWDHNLRPQNVGRERLRNCRLRNAVVQAPVLCTLRRKLIPKAWIERVKSFWTVGMDPPRVSPDLEARLRDFFDPDLAQLGSWLGTSLDCDSFCTKTGIQPLGWTNTEEFHAKTQRGRKDAKKNKKKIIG
jgi:hypothetical protein